MCQECRDEIRSIIVAMLQGDHELALLAREAARQSVELAKAEGHKLPDDAENEIYDGLIAAQVGIAAAHMAAKTNPDMTDEGGLDAALILGLWAGSLAEQKIAAHMEHVSRNLLGMGDN